jgi:hypothetical protein
MIENSNFLLEKLVQPIEEEDRESFVSILRNRKTDIDDRRHLTEWKPGSIYFHSIQDILLAVSWDKLNSVSLEEKYKAVMDSQACFVKDLDIYLENFPASEVKIRQLFELIYNVGTSFKWSEKIGLLKPFSSDFKEIDNKIIRPWVEKLSPDQSQ